MLVKPDGVQRGLVGEIVARFEKKGLKLVAMKMAWADKKLARTHYDMPESDMKALGERTIAGYKEKGIEDKRDPMDIARDVQAKLVEYLTTGPVVAMVIEGAHAVAHVRKVRGHTNPLAADVGTITSDYTIDSYQVSDADSRAIRNLVHASGSAAEASREIGLWFSDAEVFSYNLAIEEILYAKEWEKTREQIVGDK